MAVATKRKISLSLDAAALESARELNINVSAVADAAIAKAISDARREQWLIENADAFAAQAEWHSHHGNPLAEIMVAPGAATWKA